VFSTRKARSAVIYTAIAICEIAFWGFLVVGLATRYLLHRRRMSTALLLGSPAADLLLLLLVAIDLQRGGTPTQAHALAALYLGFSVAFGQRVVQWADRRFAHRFGGGPPASKPPRDEGLLAAEEWRAFRQAALAWAVACALLLAMSTLVGDRDRAEPLLGYAGMLTIGLGVWFVIGPLRASIASPHMRPRDESQTKESTMATNPPPDPRTVARHRGAEPPSRQAPPLRQWAPWWVYLGVILGANYLRQLLMPAGTVPEWTVVLIVLALSAALFVASTAVYRATGRR
jgi:hypothetical protein